MDKVSRVKKGGGGMVKAGSAVKVGGGAQLVPSVYLPLKELYLDKNCLTELGEGGEEEEGGEGRFWERFQRVTVVYASRNLITRVGESFCERLGRLNTLNISSNRLSELPAELSKLSGLFHFMTFLFHLFIYFSTLFSLPLSALTVLDVSCNLLSNSDSLERALSGLTNLVCFNCGSNNLQVREGRGRGGGWLDLGRNSTLSFFPAFFSL